MRLIPRSSRRFSARLVDYSYPVLRTRHREVSRTSRSHVVRTGAFFDKNQERRR